MFVLQTCQVKGYFSKQLLPRRREKAQKDIQSDLVPLSQGNMLQKKKAVSNLLWEILCWSLGPHTNENLCQTDNLLSNLPVWFICICGLI